MRFPRLPRLPVSRPRHEDQNNIRSIPTRASKRWWREHAEVLWDNSVQFMRERDEARARVAELEAAVRGHVTATSGHDHEHLRAVLDGHDHQDRGDEPESDHDWTGRRRWGPDWQHLQGGWP